MDLKNKEKELYQNLRKEVGEFLTSICETEIEDLSEETKNLIIFLAALNFEKEGLITQIKVEFEEEGAE